MLLFDHGNIVYKFIPLSKNIDLFTLKQLWKKSNMKNKLKLVATSEIT